MKVKYAKFDDINNNLVDYEEGVIFIVKDESPAPPPRAIVVKNSQPTESVEVKSINNVVRPGIAILPVENTEQNSLFLSGTEAFIATGEGITPLNSEIIDRQDEDRWLVRFGLYKKRVVLFSKADRNSDIWDITPPSITEIEMNLESGEIEKIVYTDNTLWEESAGDVTLIGDEVLISSSFVFASENINIDFNFGVDGVLGDTPSKVFNNFRQKYDLILFKEVNEGQAPTDRPGALLYDFPTSKLIFLDGVELNNWSPTYIEPAEGKETYAIAVALTSNVVPSIIEANSLQWTPPVLADPRARDGEQGPPGDPGEDGLDAASVRIITSSAGFKKRDNVFIPATITLSFSTENISSITSTIWEKGGVQVGTNNTLVITGSTDFASVETNTYKIIVTGTINGVENSSREAEIILNRFDEEPGAPGADGADSASVIITTSAANFKRDRSETVTPSSIVLSTIINNITGTLTYVWKRGNNTVGGNSSTYAVPSTDFSGTTTTNTYSVEVTGTINGVTASRTANIIINRIDDGPLGPTAVFKGTWESGETYTFSENQTDVVFYQDLQDPLDTGNYYILNASIGNVQLDPKDPNATWWTPFDFFQYIASQLAITEESIVRNNISIGDNADIIISSTPNDPPFLSIGQGNELGYNENGIFLGMNKPNPQSNAIPMLSLKGGQEGNFLTWNGESLDIRGDLNISEDVRYYNVEYGNTAGLTLNVFELVESGGSLDNIEFDYDRWLYDSTEDPAPLNSLIGIVVKITKGSTTVERTIPVSPLGGTTIAILSITLVVESFNLGFSYDSLVADFTFLNDNIVENEAPDPKDKIIEEIEVNIKNIFDFLISERASGSGGTTNPGGLNTHVQFNNNFAFGGSPNFTWNNSTNALTIGGSLILGSEENKATIQYTTNQARTYTIPDSGANANFVMTQGAQTIAGIKQFSNRIDASGISTTASALNSTPSSILVFGSDPSSTRRLIQTRTRVQILGDIQAASEDHVHGNISTAGTITSDTNVLSGHKIATIDGDNKVSRSNLAFGSSDSQFLRNDGTWNQVSISNVSGVTNAGASIVGVTPALTDGNYFLRLTRTGSNTFTSTWRTPEEVRSDISAAPAFTNQNANVIFAGPSTGSAAAPSFRSMVTADIPDSIVSNAKLADMISGRIKGRITSNGRPQDLTAAQVRTLLNVADGATANTGTVTSVTAGTQIGGLTMTITDTTTTPSIATSITGTGDFRNAIGASTVGSLIFTVPNPTTAGGYFLRVNRTDPVPGEPPIFTRSFRTPAQVRSDIGAAPAFTNQNANVIFAGPASGSAAAPSFRSMVTADIANSIVTNAKLANMTAGRIKGRITSDGAPQDLTAAQVRTLLNVPTFGNAGIAIAGIDYASGTGDRWLRITRDGQGNITTLLQTAAGIRTDIGAQPAFGNQAANEVFAGPATGTAGAPTFRQLVADDIPTLNQNTTGTAANVTGIVAIANGGTNATTAAGARSTLGAAPTANPTFSGQVRLTTTTLATSGTVSISFNGSSLRTQGALTGNVTYTGTNYASGRSVTIRVLNGTTTRNLTFPSGWRFLGSKPTNIAANKVGVLTLTSFGTTEASVVAAWAVEL